MKAFVCVVIRLMARSQLLPLNKSHPISPRDASLYLTLELTFTHPEGREEV